MALSPKYYCPIIKHFYVRNLSSTEANVSDMEKMCVCVCFIDIYNSYVIQFIHLFFKRFFGVDHFLKSIEFVTILLLFYLLLFF